MNKLKTNKLMGNRFNFASEEAGASVISCNPEASGCKSILNRNIDKYMRNPAKSEKWIVIGLSESVFIVSYNRF